MDGVLVTPLKRIAGPAGDVLHGLKVSAPGYTGFAEAYFSEIHEGAVKTWRRHSRMTTNLIVPRGNVCFVLYDEQGGAFVRHTIGETNYARLTVAPGLWMAFRGQGPGTSLILDITDAEHDPAEAESRDVSAFAFKW
jgi:dTDP-4-dehydrorhamnose 3,5-epimerase